MDKYTQIIQTVVGTILITQTDKAREVDAINLTRNTSTPIPARVDNELLKDHDRA